MDFISGLVGLALVAVAAITSWLDRLPAWLIPGLIALWIVETKSNAIEGTVTEAMRELKAIRATVDNIETELAEVKSMMDDLKAELADEDEL